MSQSKVSDDGFVAQFDLMKDDFHTLQTIQERVRYAWKSDTTLKTIKSYLNIYLSAGSKNSHESIEHRKNGNEQLQIYNYKEALKSYNQALRKAPFPQDEEDCYELSLCYASRANLYHQAGFYRDAISDIKEAKEAGYIEVGNLDKMIKTLIDKRFSHNTTQKIVLKLANRLGLENDIAEIFSENEIKEYNTDPLVKVVHSLPHDFSFWLSDGLDFVYSKEKGRHVKAKRPLEKDSVLILEKAYVTCISSESNVDACENCSSQIENGRIIPCRFCCDVVFCCSDCAEETWHKFHQYECGKSLKKLIHSPSYSAFKAIITIGVKRALVLAKRPSDAVKKEEEMFVDLFEMSHHFDKLDQKAVAINIIEGLIVLSYLQSTGKLNDFNLEECIELGTVIVELASRGKINNFGLNSIASDVGETLAENSSCHMGTALLLRSSEINHSCDPPCSWGFIKGVFYLKAIRDIDTGEEITISYGPHYKTSDCKKRQKFLAGNFFFTCDCIACEYETIYGRIEDEHQEQHVVIRERRPLLAS